MGNNVPNQTIEEGERSSTYNRQYDVVKENFMDRNNAMVVPPALLCSLIKLEVKEELNRRNYISKEEFAKTMKMFQTRQIERYKKENLMLKGLLRAEQRKNRDLISTHSKEIKKISKEKTNGKSKKRKKRKKQQLDYNRRKSTTSIIRIPNIQSRSKIRSPRTRPTTPSSKSERKNIILPRVNMRELLRNLDYTRDHIGAGRFGKVFRVEYDGEIVCAKIVTHTAERELRKELRLNLSISPHPNIIKLIAFCPREMGGSRFVGYLMEYCQRGSISSIITKTTQEQQRLPFGEVLRIAHQTAIGLRHIHNHNIVHYSLNWNNILMTQNKEIRISDFGSNRRIPSHEDSLNNRNNSSNFMFHIAPEVFEGYPLDKKADVYSFGIMLFELLVCTLNPYKVRWSVGNLERRKVELKAASDPSFRPKIEQFPRFVLDEKVHLVYLDIMTKCWNHESENRPSFVEIVLVLASELKKWKDFEEVKL